MRNIHIAETEEELILLAKRVKRLSDYRRPYDRTEYMAGYDNFRKKTWLAQNKEVTCQILMLCLDDETGKGITIGNSQLTGFYDEKFIVTPEGNMKFNGGFAYVFKRCRGKKHFSLLLDTMVKNLLEGEVSNLQFYAIDSISKRALGNRGYSGDSSSFWRKR